MIYTNFIWALTGERQEMEVEDGRVLYRGPAREHRTHGPEVANGGGKYLLPSYIDSHCHILPAGLDMQKLHLGKSSSHAEVLDAVRDRLWQVEPGKWLHAVHYDQTRYENGEHLTRDDLDAISMDVPIVLRHVNGHASVVNSAALRAARVDDSTQDPPGGSYGRDASGRLNGVLFENAHSHVSGFAPKPNLEDMVEAITTASWAMNSDGITCASDMQTGGFDLREELQAYQIAADASPKMRFRLYLQWSAVFGPRAIPREELRQLADSMSTDRCKIAGIKLFADGAIGSATAAIYGRYSGQAPAGPVISPKMKRADADAPEGVEVSGQLMYPREKLMQMVRTAHDAGFQIAIHSIGDYSTDLVMDAYEALGDARRHRIEHAMILSDKQIERMAKIGCHCTMQPEFMLRFAHSYQRQLGPERAARLKRARSVIDAGIPLSFSSDRPIVAGDPWSGVVTASQRPEGFDPAEAVTREEALLAYTAEAAKANEDADLMGSLTERQLADFQIFESNPLGEPQSGSVSGK